MAEQIVGGVEPQQGFSKRGWWTRLGEWLQSNPVMVKELRGRMRRRRAFIVLTAYLTGIAFVIAITYLLYVNSLQNSPATMASTRQTIGKVVFGVVTGMQLVGLTFIAPALTSGAISTEREHQTYDLLRATLLPARSVVWGKFFSSLVYVLLLLFAALPLECMAFIFGGVAPEEIAISQLLLIVASVYFCAVGLFFSSFMKSTLGSTVLSYAVPILTVFGLPLLFLVLSGLIGSALSPILYNNQNPSPALIQSMVIVAWFFVCIHPIATAVATEILLLEGHTLWGYTTNITQNVSITLISPWLPYTVLTLGMSALLIALSVRFARRRDR